MPVIDMTALRCAWCGAERGVFRCNGCYKPTCRECQIYQGEDGSCEHSRYTPPAQQGWDAR
jgi:hypothetical protein